MQARLIKVRDVSPDEDRAWRDLAPQALEPNPFFEADFLGLSSRHFPGYADATIVVAHEGDTFHGILPVVRFERPRIPPRPVTSTVGAPTAVRLLGTPLLDARCADAAMGALLDGLHDAARRRSWPGILRLEKAASDGPVMACLRRACRQRHMPLFVKETWERGVVRRGGRWEDPVTPKRQRKIEQARRGLARDRGVELTFVDRTHDPSVVDDFLAMELSGWKGQEGGLAFAKDPDKAAWFRDWYARWAPTGRLFVLSVCAGTVPIAIECFIRGGEGIFDFRAAYDETYAKYNPGVALLRESMAFLLKNTDATWLDSATDKDNAFLLEVFPERRAMSMLYVGVGGTLDRSIVRALPAMTRLAAAPGRLRRATT